MSDRPKLEILDALRGFCALIVVLLHFTENYAVRGVSAVVPHGYLPVEYFFILTGFTFVYAYDGRWGNGLTVWRFFRRRLRRMHPLIVIGSFAGLVACLIAPHLYTPQFPRELGVGELLVLFLWCCTMLPAPKALGWTLMHPLQGPLWTMFYIYVANVAYAIVLRRLRTWALIVLAVAAAGLTYWFAFRYKAFTYGPQWSGRQIGGAFVRLAFPVFAGMVIARKGWRIRLGDAALWVCIAILSAVFFAPMAVPKTVQNGMFEASFVVLALPLVLMIGAGGTISNPRLASVCRFWGAYSFPLYATHYPLTILNRIWISSNADAPLVRHLAVAGAFAAGAFLVGWLTMTIVARIEQMIQLTETK